jgi:hypothetical protein
LLRIDSACPETGRARAERSFERDAERRIGTISNGIGYVCDGFAFFREYGCGYRHPPLGQIVEWWPTDLLFEPLRKGGGAMREFG